MSTVAEFGNFATTSMINEASQFKTVKTGGYNIQVNKTYEFNEEEGFARVGARVFDGGVARGTVFLKLQWKEARSAGSGKLKLACKLYVQALKALYPTKTSAELATMDAKDVISDLEKFPVNSFIKEYYSVPDDSNSYGSRRVTPTTPEEVQDILKQGGTPRNEVLSISAIR